MGTKFRSWVCVVTAASTMLAVGCTSGPKKVKVTGRFVRDGQPVTYPKNTYVTLMFIPEDDKSPRVPARVNNEAGTFEAEVLAGRYRASIFVLESTLKPENTPPPTSAQGSGELYDLMGPTQLDLPVPAPKAGKK